MKARVLVGGHQLEVSVGSGSQSFQWLASVVQERLKAQNVLRKSLQVDSYIITEIRNANGELINPKDKLYEHATTTTGLVVSATVATAFPVDDWENPQMNDWMQAAYVHSAVGKHWAQEIDAWRVSLQQIKSRAEVGLGGHDLHNLNTSLMTQRLIPQTAQFVKIGFDFTEADVELAFNLDWQAMQWKWLSTDTRGDALRSKIGDVLKASYALVCNVFTHYAGAGKGAKYHVYIGVMTY
jgi:hypothetical protein